MKIFSAKIALSQAGFTLTETLVVIFVFALAVIAVSGLILAAYNIHNHTFKQSLAIGEARRGVETMVKEIREARMGDDGSYPIVMAGEKEFIFYSDIDKDGDTERVRYFLGTAGSGFQEQECVSFADGGSCNVTFSNFSSGTFLSAEVQVSVEGDFGSNQEYAEIYADSVYLGRICRTGCLDCAGIWQGTATFDVSSLADDNNINFLADATGSVDNVCDWQQSNHSMKAKFEFSWVEDFLSPEGEFKKGIIDPTAPPVTYPPDQEKVSILSYYVRNTPPIFEYFDENGVKIDSYPARLKDTKVIKVFLAVDVDPARPPEPFELESSVQLRNLKEEF